MRLYGQQKMGYYPCPPAAVALAAERLRAPAKPFNVLDPCAGEGLAVRQLGELTGCAPDRVHAVELDEGRAQTLRANLPEAKVLGPASFFGCKITPGSVGLLWLNPPFDDGWDGMRVEGEFLEHAVAPLQTGGVLALVCPEGQLASSYSDVRSTLCQWFDCFTVVKFPEDHRHYDEVITLAVKRKLPRPNGRRDAAWYNDRAEKGAVYQIPPGPAPKRFEKVEMTEEELQRALASSPLRRRLENVEPFVPPSPPLALGTGHVALLLASGHLDGLVCPEGEPPHVVRGTARKAEYVSNVEENENDDGTITTKTTISERIQLVVRAVAADGEIITFLEGE